MEHANISLTDQELRLLNMSLQHLINDLKNGMILLVDGRPMNYRPLEILQDKIGCEHDENGDL